MLNLILAMVSSAMVSVIMRIGSEGSQPRKPMLAVNYLACFGISLLFLPKAVPGPGIGFAAALGMAGGILYFGAFLLLQRNVRENGIALSSLFMKLGVIVPTLLGIVFFREEVAATRIAGIALTGAVIVVLCGRPEAGSLRNSGLRWLFLLLLCSGMADGLSKIYNACGDPALEGWFLCFIFAFALVLSAGLCLWLGQRPVLRDVLFGLLLGIPNYFSSRFLLLALYDIPASVAFPVFSCGTILLASALGRLLFRERITRRQGVAIALALGALVMLNI